MPVRLPLVTEHATRVLLEGIVDYAGLFPPAAVAMHTAVRNYAHYRAGGTAWMLGRFVCPAAALEEFSRLADPLLPRDAGAIPWRLTAVSSDDVSADMTRIAEFNARHRVCFEECGALVDAYEVRVGTMREFADIDATVPRDLVTYMEMPYADAHTLLPLLPGSGRRAKLRTGGVTPGAFPEPDAIVTFLRLCLRHEIVAKATAGLHHPVCGDYRLTYADDAPVGHMFGYLNVFLAAALLLQGESPDDARRLLLESDPSAFAVDEHAVTWRGASPAVRLERATLKVVREQLLVSFGSCSFTEPVDELRAMGWL